MNVTNYNVMKNKHSYSAPEAELLEVKIEERFLTESPGDYSDPGYNPNLPQDQNYGTF